MLKPIANHSDLLKLNLQFFADDDVILPDDFTPEEPIEPTEPVEPIEPTDPVKLEGTPQPTEPTEPTEQQLIKLKYNHEEKEIPLDEAIQLAQMGMNYPKLQERLQALESDPRLAFIENIASQYGMTTEEYMTAVQQQQEQARIDELVQQGISEELAQEMLENRKFREQFEAEKKAKAEQEKSNVEFSDFFEYFKEANGRDYVPDKDVIPESVWEANKNGVPLKFAYMAHENQQLKQQLQTHKQNASNAQKAPVGSVTAHGGDEIASEDPFLAGFNSI